MKIRTLGKLEDSLNEDLVWRKREITSLKFLLNRTRKSDESVLFKAAITLMYAHWEGHVKFCSHAYLNYLNHLGLSCELLSDSFVQMNLGAHFEANDSVRNYKIQKKLHEYFCKPSTYTFKVDEEKAISTKSNLNYEILESILNKLSLSTEDFKLKENFIDATLIDYRNAIAHGEKRNSEDIKSAYASIEEHLLGMIQSFHEIIKTSASNKEYLKHSLSSNLGSEL